MNIPNKLKKYLDGQPLKRSYIKKLSILLNSNDSNYKYKRTKIDELSSAYDESNKEFLTGAKIKNYSQNDESDFQDCQIPNLAKSSILDKIKEKDFPLFLNENIEYFRSPKVIINNEKIILETFKKKNKLTNKIPYLSRSRNDLIIFDYKKMTNKSYNPNNISKNIKNEYLSSYMRISKIEKMNIKKVNSQNLKFSYNKISSVPTRLNNNNNKIKRNFLLPIIYKNSQSMIFKSKGNNYGNNLDQPKENNQKANIGCLSNKDLLKKLKNSVQNSLSMKKLKFINKEKSKNSNKMLFLFGKNFI